MASTPPNNNDELPVIWLAAPDALLPSNHPIPIQPLPTAISATLALLILLILTILYHRSPNDANAPQQNIDLAPVRITVPVLRPQRPQRRTPPTPFHHHSPTTTPTITTTTPDIVSNLETRNPPATDDASALPASQDTTPIQVYHSYLKDSIHEHCPRDAASPRPRPRSPHTRNSYTAPLCSMNLKTQRQHNAVKDGGVKSPHIHPVLTAASSDYSVSVDPTPRPSRQNSFCRGQPDGAWTRLRLGSDYDGGTFVPSEANIRLGGRKGKTRWA